MRPGGMTPRRMAAGFLALTATMAALPAHVRGNDDVVAIYSSVSPDYKRTPRADGMFNPESYAFGEGGLLDALHLDATIDRLGFLDIARIVAPALAAQNYLPCDTHDPQSADLLIMVYWGTTSGTDDTASSSPYAIAHALVPPPVQPPPMPPDGLGGTEMVSDPSTSGRASLFAEMDVAKCAADAALEQSVTLSSMANQQRDRQNIRNAAILGYLPEMQRVSAYRMTALDSRRRDVVGEVEESRYYVVLLAYDFRTLRRHKQRKLLWETRFSIPERGRDFSRELAAMAQAASRSFGQDSGGLKRTTLREGTVHMGDLIFRADDKSAEKK